MSHYYQFDKDLASNKKILSFYINDAKLDFISDAGVFSNTQIDYGSSLLIKSIIKHSDDVETLLDVGCGYGVIGITLAYFKKCKYLTQIDINERAVELTCLNIESLKIENANAFVSDGFVDDDSTYDLIAINPPIRCGKKVIYKMYEDSVKHLKDNGSLWIVIKKSLGADSSIAKLQTLYKNVEVICKDKGYYIIKSFN